MNNTMIDVMVSGESGPAIQARYTNHRGETKLITVRHEAIHFGTTEHYPEPQWLLEDYELTRCVHRVYALKNMEVISHV